jgi:hypothetical protein
LGRNQVSLNRSKVYDGADSSAPELATICGYSASQTSTSANLFVKMKSDNVLAGNGFSATYYYV